MELTPSKPFSELAKPIIYHFIIQDITKDEGVRGLSYDDHLGFRTVGIGFNMANSSAKKIWQDAGIPEDFTKVYNKKQKLSEESMIKLVYFFIDEGMAEVKKLWPDYDNLSINRQRALFNMYYQMGLTTLLKFKNSNKYINGEEWGLAARNLKQSLWARQTPHRAQRVIDWVRYG